MIKNHRQPSFSTQARVRKIQVAEMYFAFQDNYLARHQSPNPCLIQTTEQELLS